MQYTSPPFYNAISIILFLILFNRQFSPKFFVIFIYSTKKGSIIKCCSFVESKLLNAGTSNTSSVLSRKCPHLVKNKFWLVFHNAKLTDPIVFVNDRIAQRVSWHIPPVICTTIRVIHNSSMVRLNNAKIFVGATAWYNMRLIPFRQLHCHP